MEQVIVCAFLWGDWPRAEDYVRRLFKGRPGVRARHGRDGAKTPARPEKTL